MGGNTRGSKAASRVTVKGRGRGVKSPTAKKLPGKKSLPGKLPRSPVTNSKNLSPWVKGQINSVKRKIILKDSETGANNNATPAKTQKFDHPEVEFERSQSDAQCNRDEPDHCEDDQIRLSVDIDEDDSLDNVDTVDQGTSEQTQTKTPQREQSSQNDKRFDVPQAIVQSPELQQMLQYMVEQGVKSALEHHDRQSVAMQTPVSKGKSPQVTVVKSPSDTTIYALALKIAGTAEHTVLPTNATMENIENYVRNIRLQVENDNMTAGNSHIQLPIADQQNDGDRAGPSRPVSRAIDEGTQQPSQSKQTCPVIQDEQALLDQARAMANDQIVCTEQQKAVTDPLQGLLLDRYSDLVDDEFFHITCHVDASLRE